MKMRIVYNNVLLQSEYDLQQWATFSYHKSAILSIAVTSVNNKVMVWTKSILQQRVDMAPGPKVSIDWQNLYWKRSRNFFRGRLTKSFSHITHDISLFHQAIAL